MDKYADGLYVGLAITGLVGGSVLVIARRRMATLITSVLSLVVIYVLPLDKDHHMQMMLLYVGCYISASIIALNLKSSSPTKTDAPKGRNATGH